LHLLLPSPPPLCIERQNTPTRSRMALTLFHSPRSAAEARIGPNPRSVGPISPRTSCLFFSLIIFLSGADSIGLQYSLWVRPSEFPWSLLNFLFNFFPFLGKKKKIFLPPDAFPSLPDPRDRGFENFLRREHAFLGCSSLSPPYMTGAEVDPPMAPPSIPLLSARVASPTNWELCTGGGADFFPRSTSFLHRAEKVFSDRLWSSQPGLFKVEFEDLSLPLFEILPPPPTSRAPSSNSPLSRREAGKSPFRHCSSGVSPMVAIVKIGRLFDRLRSCFGFSF